jgi:hypothetical protein
MVHGTFRSGWGRSRVSDFCPGKGEKGPGSNDIALPANFKVLYGRDARGSFNGISANIALGLAAERAFPERRFLQRCTGGFELTEVL